MNPRRYTPKQQAAARALIEAIYAHEDRLDMRLRRWWRVRFLAFRRWFWSFKFRGSGRCK